MEAAAKCRRAIELRPDYGDAYNNLGIALRAGGQVSAAVAAFRRAAELCPDVAAVWVNLGAALEASLDVRGAVEADRRALALEPGNAEALDHLLMTFLYSPDVSPEEVAAEHAKWGRQASDAVGNPPQYAASRRDPGRKLRVGYVSANFRQHSVAHFIEPLLASHDRSAVQVHCYSNVATPDDTTARLRGLVDGWREIRALDDAAAAELIRRDEVDVLVDLSGHSNGNRLGVFARRAAPVQVTYLGYPATTGLPQIGWRLTDSLADPADGPAATDALHTERLIRLPDTFLCYRPPSDAAPTETGTRASLNGGAVTFGSFNNLVKVHLGTVALWARLLRAVPGSRLVLKSLGLADEGVRQYCRDAFASHEVSADRLDLLPWTKTIGEHLADYGRIDVALDTYPYNGTTTTCEALYMGVPVVTLAGRAHVSRVGVSILANVGLSDLVAGSEEEYVTKAAELAGDRERLMALRRELRGRLLGSPLCDAPPLARNVEAAYRRAWETYCAAG